MENYANQPTTVNKHIIKNIVNNGLTGPASILCHFLSFLKNAIDKRTPDPPWNFFPKNLYDELNQDRIANKQKFWLQLRLIN